MYIIKIIGHMLYSYSGCPYLSSHGNNCCAVWEQPQYIYIYIHIYIHIYIYIYIYIYLSKL